MSDVTEHEWKETHLTKDSLTELVVISQRAKSVGEPTCRSHHVYSVL
jgi:hypothetical protein